MAQDKSKQRPCWLIVTNGSTPSDADPNVNFNAVTMKENEEEYFGVDEDGKLKNPKLKTLVEKARPEDEVVLYCTDDEHLEEEARKKVVAFGKITEEAKPRADGKTYEHGFRFKKTIDLQSNERGEGGNDQKRCSKVITTGRPPYRVPLTDIKNVEIKMTGLNFQSVRELDFEEYMKIYQLAQGYSVKDVKDMYEKNSVESNKEKVERSKNVIFRGAPGTGKTYMARQVAARIINPDTESYDELSEDEKGQIGFVQFHSSYDYTDFVEGLRPRIKRGRMVYELNDGTFREFVKRARTAYEQYESKVRGLIQSYRTSGPKGMTEQLEDETKRRQLEKDLMVVVEADVEPNAQQEAIRTVLGVTSRTDERVQQVCAVLSWLGGTDNRTPAKPKPYVFIIDEINRGDISKILGELFFSIDPGYRGPAGAVSTQYANMRPQEKDFYIPKNVYVIGTMNDIDRSVESFDFAMRRRFRFIEITPEDSAAAMMKDVLPDELVPEARDRMKHLNKKVMETPGLNANYCIGPAYFLKLKDLLTEASEEQTSSGNTVKNEGISKEERKIVFDRLWSDYLEPLIQEYVRGLDREEDLIKDLKAAYENVA